MANSCPVPVSSLLSSSSSPITPRLHYLLSGTFNTLWMYLLAFSPYSSPPTLSISKKYRAEGPHQYLALNHDRSRVYATTWAQPPSLSSWEVLDGGSAGITKVNTVPISATGSYLSVLPSSLSSSLSLSPSSGARVFQAGGPVAQTFAVDAATGGFGEQLQEVIYLDGGEQELWDDETDRTRVALRYGSHAVDVDPVLGRAYVPHVGRDSIYVYSFNPDGTLHHLAEVPSHGHRGHEGVRHSVPSRDGSKLYVVTEHTSYLDVYTVHPHAPYLIHSQRLSVIPASLNALRLQYRGDTLRLSSDGRRLYVTTRGKTPRERGWVSVWKVADDGSIDESDISSSSSRESQEEETGYGALSRFETPTSGGKANAIEVCPFHVHVTPPRDPTTAAAAAAAVDGHDYVVLTDDEQGWVWVLEWRDEWNELREVAGVQLGRQDGADEDESGTGASHAVWLS
ncbi:hypothetical protein JCM1840_002537 [Sporobolomyces johnsonii]